MKYSFPSTDYRHKWMADDSACKLLSDRRPSSRQRGDVWLSSPPPFTTAPVWRVRYFIFNPPDTSLLTLCAQLHNTLIIHTPHHPLTDSQIIPLHSCPRPTSTPPIRNRVHVSDQAVTTKLYLVVGINVTCRGYGEYFAPRGNADCGFI